MNRKPNILFILSDQQRWDTCGCYGQPLDTTPNLDQMAAEGVKFEHAFTCQPVCGPARACLQSGRYPEETGNYRNNKVFPRDERSLAKIMSDNGYETGYLGKWHLAGPEFRSSAVSEDYRGGYKDYWLAAEALEHTSHSYDGHVWDSDGHEIKFPPGQYRVDVLTSWTVDYLKNRKTEKPFFCFLSFLEPHHQNDHRHYEGPVCSKDKFGDFIPPGDLVGLHGDWKEEYPDYLGCVNSIDRNVGKLRDFLRESGLEENTLLIYTTDHGCHFRTRNSEYKRSCHEACTRIPMIMYGPGFKGGKVIEELVSIIDLPPTVLNSAGAEVPEAMRGRPLQELCGKNKPEWRKEVFMQLSEAQVGRAIRTERWKYSVWVPNPETTDVPGSSIYHESFLYDLKNDPHEHRNLVKDLRYAEIRSELRERLKRNMAEAGEEIPDILPA